MRKLLLAVFFYCSLAAYGQGSAAVDKRFIEVMGTASRQVTPDRIFLAITLKNQVLNRQQITMQQQEEQLRQLLLKNKIDLSLLTLADASADVLSSRKKTTDYELKKEFVLQLATAEQVARVAQELQAAHLGELTITKTEYSKIESLQKEVRIAAIKAAKEKADYLLQALGEQTDRPLEIQETQENIFMRTPVSNRLLSNSLVDNSEANDLEISFSKIQVKFSYSVKFGIK